STIAGNTSPAAIASSIPVQLYGTIVDHPLGRACAAPNPVSSVGFNLASDSTCGLTLVGDQQGGPALLGPLFANGGPTPTKLPFSNSPALDTVPVGTPLLCLGVVQDQRGVSRPDGPACDKGAAEGSLAAAGAPLSLTVNDNGDADDALPGDGVCATA